MSTSRNDEGFCAEILRVLADETRMGVVRLLLAGPLHVKDMLGELGVEQSLLSHHLRILREAGLVVASRDGKSMLYRLARSVAVRRRGHGLDLGCCRLVFEEEGP